MRQKILVPEHTTNIFNKVVKYLNTIVSPTYASIKIKKHMDDYTNILPMKSFQKAITTK